jgi:hypothetical protein
MTLPNKLTPPSLLEKLTQADICCRDCGEKYGTYSVGCSSTWIAECPICGETKGCTEVRDWGYLTKGIQELNGKRPAEPIMDDDELEETLSKTKYRSTVSQVCVHREDEFRTLQTTVSLTDEGGGEFITLTDNEGNEIRLDFEEFEEVIKAVALLKNQ